MSPSGNTEKIQERDRGTELWPGFCHLVVYPHAQNMMGLCKAWSFSENEVVQILKSKRKVDSYVHEGERNVLRGWEIRELAKRISAGLKYLHF